MYLTKNFWVCMTSYGQYGNNENSKLARPIVIDMLMMTMMMTKMIITKQAGMQVPTCLDLVECTWETAQLAVPIFRQLSYELRYVIIT